METPPPKSPKSVRQATPLTVWTSNLKTEQAKNDFQELLALSGSSPVIKRLLDIIQETKLRQQHESLSKAKYDNSSWPYQQADNVGYQRALSFVEGLLKGIIN